MALLRGTCAVKMITGLETESWMLIFISSTKLLCDTGDQALSLWSGSTDSKTLDYQRTHPREYQIVRTQRKSLEYKTRHHPTTSNTLCRMPHLNNKQNKNTNPIIRRQEYHLTQPCPSEEKQTNKQKLSTDLTL